MDSRQAVSVRASTLTTSYPLEFTAGAETARLARACRGDHAHTILEGFAKDPLTGQTRPRTDIASEYSPAFCKAHAQAATDFFTGGRAA